MIGNLIWLILRFIITNKRPPGYLNVVPCGQKNCFKIDCMKSGIVKIFIPVIACGLIFSGYCRVWALTAEEINSLRKAGLNERTIDIVAAHQEDQDRKREPVVTVDEVRQLLEAGFSEKMIRLFIRLDRVTGEGKVSVSPEHVGGYSLDAELEKRSARDGTKLGNRLSDHLT